MELTVQVHFQIAAARWIVRTTIGLIYVPLLFLSLVSLGSGWAFPNLLPDRIDGAPWRNSFIDGNDLMRAAGTSIILSAMTASVSTLIGFLLARTLRQIANPSVLYLLYLPFVVSPVIAGVCLYDLAIRLRLVGILPGVLLFQCVFSTSFAAIFFHDAFSNRLARTENLIRTLGGGRLEIWQHAIWPQCRGFIWLCLIQTALYSWLDYGLVSVIGGGHVVPLTVKLFGYIREASTNQAALASLILLFPAIVGSITTLLRSSRIRRTYLSENVGNQQWQDEHIGDVT